MDTIRRDLMARRDAALAAKDYDTFQRLTREIADLPLKGVGPLTQRDIDRYNKRHATQNIDPRTKVCFFASCGAPVTHRVFQVWNNQTKYCCEHHIPGAKARPGIDPQAGTFYRVEKIAHASKP